MTNFLGYRVIKGKRTEPVDSVDFIIKKHSGRESEKLWQYQVTNYQMGLKRKLPLTPFWLKLACLFFWLVVFLALFLGPLVQPDMDLVQSYHNAPLLCWGAVLCFVIWLVLVIYERVRMKRIENTTEYRNMKDQMQQLEQEIMQIFGISEMAESIDVLSERYVMKKGKPRHKDSNYGMTPYKNLDMFAYVQNGNLCLADVRYVWEIPLSSLRSMKLAKWIYGYPDWNKSEPVNSDKYRPYRIISKYGVYYSRCYRIEISDIRGEFYLLIPVYDGEAFTRLTHLRSEEKS